MAFDVSNACLGLLSGMLQVANMIELGQIRAGVVVGTGEQPRPWWKPPSPGSITDTFPHPQRHQAGLGLADNRLGQRGRGAGGSRAQPHAATGCWAASARAQTDHCQLCQGNVEPRSGRQVGR